MIFIPLLFGLYSGEHCIDGPVLSLLERYTFGGSYALVHLSAPTIELRPRHKVAFAWLKICKQPDIFATDNVVVRILHVLVHTCM
jgi:hypothetical protein